MPKSKPLKRTAWLIALALVILALIPLAIQQNGKKEDAENVSSTQAPTQKSTLASRQATTRRSQRSTSEKLPPSHKAEDLKTFILPPSEFANITLEEALDTIFHQYREICYESGESPISFNYEIEGTPEIIVFAKLQGNFLTNLNYLAAMAGTTVKIEDDQLLFTEIEDGPVTTRRWTIPPTFIEWVGYQYGINNPFQGEGLAPRTSMTGMLKTLGFIKENESGSYLSSSLTLIGRGGPKSQSRLDALVKAIASDVSHQTRIKFLEEEDQPLSLTLIPHNLGTIERNDATPHQGLNIQVIFRATERGFGRHLQAISFTDKFPTQEDRIRYLNTGDVSDLGVSENLSQTTYNLSFSKEGETQLLTFKDEHGTIHQKTFITERIYPDGRIIPVPE